MAHPDTPALPRCVAELALLVAGGLVLLAVGDRLPPVDQPGLLARDPALAAAAGLRLLALAAVAHLVALHLLGLLLRPLPRRAGWTARIPVWLGRRTVERALGAGVAATVGLTLPTGVAGADPIAVPAPQDGGPAADDPARPDVILMVPLGDPVEPTSTGPTTGRHGTGRPPDGSDGAGPAAVRPGGAGPNGSGPGTATPDHSTAQGTPGGPTTAVMVAMGAGEPVGGAPDAPADAAAIETAGGGVTAPAAPGPATEPPKATSPDPAEDQAPDPDPAVLDDAGTWEVTLGDHLWAIATETLADAGRATGDGDVAAYWAVLIEANRHQLVDPEDPDLLLPGQRLVLPALPVSAGTG